MTDKSDPKLNFLKTLDETLKQECLKKFDGYFQNDKFENTHEIPERYEKEFKNIINLYINKYVFNLILENISTEEYAESVTMTGIPDFLSIYYNTTIFQFIEKEPLPAF